ncbi:hypothetical protein [Microbacterium sp.]|uniref:hypothetical protein n=1 Tax=Microbacterium sp. TaxID=51671 RepID=UPI0037CA4187
MTYRSISTLESWLGEFRRGGPALVGRVRVIPQDGAERADAGLVVVDLANAPTVTYLQPDAADPGRWIVTMESREDVVTVDAGQLRILAADLEAVSRLCVFLEQKSLTG